MKRFSHPAIMVTLSVLGCGAGWSQGASSPFTLEQLVVANTAIGDSLDRIPKVIAEEIAAGRLELKDSQLDRSRASFLRGMVERGWLDDAVFHSRGGMENRTGNARLGAAWDAFRAAIRTRQNMVRDDLPNIIDTRVQAAAEAWRRARVASDLSESIESLRAIREAARRMSPLAGKKVPDLDRVLDYLSKSKDLLAAEETGDASLIGRASAELEWRDTSSPFGDFLSLKELEDRRKKGLTRLREQGLDTVRTALEALPKAETPDEIEPWIARLHAAADAEGYATRRQDGKWDARISEAEQIAREWREMLALEAAGAWPEAISQGRNLQRRVAGMFPSLAQALTARRAALAQKQGEVTQRSIDLVISRLESLQTAEEARSLAKAIRTAREQQESDSNDSEVLAHLLVDLDRLGRFDLGGGRYFAPSEALSTGHPWQAQVRAAYQRLIRIAAARQLQLPQLLEAPLKERPFEEGLRSIIGAAAARKDWAEVHRLIANAAPMLPAAPMEGEGKAVRAFLLARNFEKAELFADAVDFYRQVILLGGLHAPVTESHARLKELKQLHPELFTQAP